MKMLLPVIVAILSVISGPRSSTAEALSVAVSILPQQYFVQQLAGERVAVQVMVSPGASPETYEPKPLQMAALSTAKLYFAIGVPFEQIWLPRIAGKNLTIVHTDARIAKIPMHGHHHEDAPQGARESDPAGAPDPHIWLSPALVKVQVEHILNALLAADPEGAREYRRNFERFGAQIDQLDSEIKGLLSNAQGKTFLAFHPAWGYFAQAYGLEQMAIEIDGREPGPASLRRQIEIGRQLGVKWIFVQPQFSTKSARLVADAIGAEVVAADPLAPDWPQNLRRVAMNIKSALE